MLSYRNNNCYILFTIVHILIEDHIGYYVDTEILLVG